MRAHPPRGALLALALATTLAALAASVASAEISIKEGVKIAFSGGISPQRLPRSAAAPVTVLMGAKISMVDRSEAPELKRMVLDINRHGTLTPDGLPTCSESQLNSLSASAALRACGGALVGHGNVTTRITLPSNGTFASNGGLLAFNGRIHGRPAVFAQVTATTPLPLSFVIAFEVRKIHGKYGTSLIGTVPPIASGYGKISAINLSLHRTYTAHGRAHSYVSADCPAAAGFTGASFAFAHVSFSFANGTTVSETLERQCKVG